VNRLTFSALFVSPTLVLAITTPPAWSQDRRAAALEEIVVYARKTEENQQTVPISMVVNTGEQLEAAQVVDFQDITKVTPGLTITSEDPTSTSMKIRGVGLSFFGLAADPGVVITVDEFPQSRIGSVFGAFLDVRQVEVLKGPQGTLYGRNAPSGVISIWSNRPDYEGIHGRMELSSSSYDTYLGEGAVNIPIVDDKLAVRLAYIHRESDGYTDLAEYEAVPTGEDSFNYIYSGRKVHADDIDGDSGRVSVLFEPTESLSFTTRYNHTDYETGLISQVADGPMVFTEDSAVLEPNGNVYVADRDDNIMFQDDKDYSDYTLDELGLRTEWSTESGRVVSLTQYQEFDTELSETTEGKPSPFIQPRILTSNDELFSQELRWHSQIGDSIEYLVGGFYADHDINISYEQLEQATQQQITVFGTQENQSYALFTNWYFQLNEQWSFSLGGRYNDEEETIESNLDLSAILGDGGDTINVGQVNDKQEDDNTSFSFKARYQYTPDVLFYFAWDSAYKSGGYNPQVANISSVFPGNENIATLEQDFLEYPAEESIAYEVGMKSIWLDQSLLFNVALFYQDFDDFQNFSAADGDRIGGFSLGVLINSVDTVNTRGVELETSWLISDAWTASLAGSFASATVDDWNRNFCDDDDDTEDPNQLYCPLSSGDRLNDDPKWTANAQLAYRQPLDFYGMTLFSNLSYAFRAEEGGDDDSSLGTLDANIGVEINNWSLKAWSTNVFDERDYSGRSTVSEVEGVDNFFLGTNIRPRTLGFTAIYTFGGG
jgi:iron complex outermembrane receptor protein